MSDKEMNFNDIVRLTSDDKQVRMNAGVYNGTASMAIFSNDSSSGNFKPLAKFNLSVYALRALETLVKKMHDLAPEAKLKAPTIVVFDREAKKWNTIGSITLGRDANHKPYIGITHKDLPKPAKFIIRGQSGLDFAEALTPQEQAKMDIDWFAYALGTQIPAAITHTSYKIDRQGGPGGKGGYSGGGNRGGYSGGGGGGSRSSSGGEDEIPF